MKVLPSQKLLFFLKGYILSNQKYFSTKKGPVRSVHFHPTQPLFVSGGDDYKIRVWNYKQRKCIFTLEAHLDYIRTVEFHQSQPWILSASDDQTIKIWNWQSRKCIAVLSGHNHYVMCARFHPTEEMVVSASLDQTVRVWDISGLLKKSQTPQTQEMESMASRLPQTDLFGFSDAVLKYAPLEGHDRGVNWVAFHPTLPLLVSGADDRQVKLWRMNENRAWEVDTMRGHFNNVSCVLFHPRQELVLSNSEDRTIRVWDMTKSTALHTFRRDSDRFWILDAHPKQNLFAAGHDSGLIVFKLERERPAYTTYKGKKKDTLYYIKDRHLRAYDFSSGKDTPKMAVRKTSSSWKPFSLSYNAAEKAVLVSSETGASSDSSSGSNTSSLGSSGNSGEASYELYLIPDDENKGGENSSKRGTGRCPTWVARNKFAVLDKTNQIVIKTLDNSVNKKISPPHSNTDYIFPASAGRVLLRSEEKITLFDLSLRKSLAEMNVPLIKYVVWSGSGKDAMVALMGREVVILATRELEHLSTVHETIKIKSGVWDENGVFIYTTEHHIKYCLPNGDNGIIRTLDIPIYLTCVKENKIYCLDRECKNRVISVDTTEYLFKLALMKKDFAKVYNMVAKSNLIGKSIVAYLQKKRYPEIALCFVKDERTRFDLGVECGDLEVALDAAIQLNDNLCWERLADEAMRHGNVQIVEKAYQITKNFEKLSFLYLITGKLEKLGRMRKIAEVRGHNMARFHNNLFLGDWENLTTVLQEVGQVGMAHLASLTFGLSHKREAIEEQLKQRGEGEEVKLPSSYPLLSSQTKTLLPLPPLPLLHQLEGDDNNWPLLRLHPSPFQLAANKKHSSSLQQVMEEEGEVGEEGEEGEEGEVDDFIVLPGEEEGGKKRGKKGKRDLEEEGEEQVGEEEEGGGWEEGPSVELQEEEEEEEERGKGGKKGKGKKGRGGGGEGNYFVAPPPGTSPCEDWVKSSPLGGDHVAGGNLASAMQLLHLQAGIVNFAPLKELFSTLFLSTRLSLPSLPSTPPLFPLLRRGEHTKSGVPLPSLPLSLDSLISLLKLAYSSMTEGKFKDASKHFRNILHSAPLLVLHSRKQVGEASDLISLCREYLVGIILENARKACKDDSKRQAELAAYFTHCNLQPKHLMLSLKSAMKCSFDIKNYLTASILGKRLLQLKPDGALAKKTKQVIQFCDKNPSDALKLNYDPKNIFVICAVDLLPIYKGSPSTLCPLCGASFLPKHKGKLCSVCQLSEIGKECKGLRFIASQQKD